MLSLSWTNSFDPLKTNCYKKNHDKPENPPFKLSIFFFSYIVAVLIQK